jgi:AcrR family transcriptional regulator
VNTKQVILEAAKKLFVKKGYEATTVREICEVSRVSMSAINYHFENKQNLYLEILNSFDREANELGFQALEPPESGEGFKLRLRFFIDNYISNYLNETEVYTLMFRELEGDSKFVFGELKDVVDESYRKLLTFLEEAKYMGVINPEVNSGHIAVFIYNNLMSQLSRNDFSAGHFGMDLNDASFRKNWINSLVSLIYEGTKFSDVGVSSEMKVASGD